MVSYTVLVVISKAVNFSRRSQISRNYAPVANFCIKLQILLVLVFGPYIKVVRNLETTCVTTAATQLAAVILLQSSFVHVVHLKLRS